MKRILLTIAAASMTIASLSAQTPEKPKATPAAQTATATPAPTPKKVRKVKHSVKPMTEKKPAAQNAAPAKTAPTAKIN